MLILWISGFAIGLATSTAFPAKGQCVPATLDVVSVSGNVLVRGNAGELPVTDAVVTLTRMIRGENIGSFVSKQSVGHDGAFAFRSIKPGKYLLRVSAVPFSDFDLILRLNRSKRHKSKNEIAVIMGTEFTRECTGSFAELRVKQSPKK